MNSSEMISSVTLSKGGDLDAVRLRMRAAVFNSGLTYQQIGERMGYEGDSAKTLISRLLNTDRDPRISTVIAFAKAVGISCKELFT